MSFRFRKRARRCAGSIAARGLVLVGLTATAFIAPADVAEAQNLFDSLFGRRWSPPSAYADPNAHWSPFGWGAPPQMPQYDSGGSVAYCVRLCDGRFFPVQRHGGVSMAQACSSFCPASQTRIYHGSSIDQAVAQDGKRYADLSTAFVYRQRIVPDCSCNGKDAFGLVNTPIENDATLQRGDIVATRSGLMAYNGVGRRQAFTPIQSYSGVSAELRRKLTETRITRETAPAEASSPPKPAEVKQGGGTVRNTRNKQVQSDR